jgi:hypothetical protein
MRAMRIRLGVVLVLLVSACATANKDDKKAPPTPAREVVSGGATVRGGGIRMDVQIGRPFVQTPTRSTDTVAKPNAVVTQ